MPMATYTKQYTISCLEDFREIIMAEFAAVGFDSFQEIETGFIAHTNQDIEQSVTDEIISRYHHQADVNYKIDNIEVVNWNKKWEESFEPIVIADKVIVRALFHEPAPQYPYEIIITPKMSFGTGHHETTALMMEAQLRIDHTNKQILDAGCGTGILTILAGKLGASTMHSYDNDIWVRDNIQENYRINHTTSEIQIGTIDTINYLPDYDIILANINKNILLHDIPYYGKLLVAGGILLLSGFYEEDLEDIKNMAEQNDLQFTKSLTKNRWVMAQFLK